MSDGFCGAGRENDKMGQMGAVVRNIHVAYECEFRLIANPTNQNDVYVCSH